MRVLHWLLAAMLGSLLVVGGAHAQERYARANPGKINFASGGTGSGNHLATEHFSQMAGIRMTHVPYKGSTAGVGDLISGQIQLIFSGLTGMIPHQANRVRGIAVTSAKRSNAVPDLPTVGETVPGYESVGWAARLMFPAISGCAALPSPCAAHPDNTSSDVILSLACEAGCSS